MHQISLFYHKKHDSNIFSFLYAGLYGLVALQRRLAQWFQRSLLGQREIDPLLSGEGKKELLTFLIHFAVLLSSSFRK